MTKTNAPEIRLALFGQSASGKTTFLASYFGNQQRNSFEEAHGYRLEAEDISDGNQLLSRYYRMEAGEFPLGTEQFTEHGFGLKLHGLPEPGLRIVWYDYPGGWWERTPKDNSEKLARREAFAKLLTSHVGILLIDGMRFRKDGLPYVRQLFDQFRAEVRRISDDFKNADSPLETLPHQWVLAISKADLLSADQTAEVICKEIVAGAADQLAGVAKAMNSTTFGNQFLLLSSVRGDGARVTDAHQYVGLHLVAPVALVSVLSELASKETKGSGFGMLRGIVERLAALVDLIDKLDDFLPPKYQVLTQLLKALDLKDGLDKGAEYFREKQTSAAKRGNSLEAAAAAMRAELASTDAQQAFYRNQG
jgi:GTPase SAR1 family protein